MLEPKQSVETEETAGAELFVEGAEGERNEMLGARAAGEGSRPDPELAERAQRRKFTAAYKLRILREAAGATKSGEIAAMLRREGLYTSHLTAWRKQQDAGALAGLEPRKRGPSGPSSEQVELRALRARLEHAETELATARRVIEVQGNVSALLEDLLAPRGALDTQPRPGR
ncbi:MAG TPA: transposase [Solirubrobacteraceae bacterium]|nr:transposase [Solirubrobacteraceae bacterium]